MSANRPMFCGSVMISTSLHRAGFNRFQPAAAAAAAMLLKYVVFVIGCGLVERSQFK